MDTRSVEDRLDALEARGMATGLALLATIKAAIPDHDERRIARDMVCTALETLYERTTGERSHRILQIALDEAEALFQTAPSPSRDV